MTEAKQIRKCRRLVSEYFNGCKWKCELWFKTPNPMLGEISPNSMIKMGRVKKLLEFIQDARHGNTP